jgi:hypothetical protein
MHIYCIYIFLKIIRISSNYLLNTVKRLVSGAKIKCSQWVMNRIL